MRSLSTSLKRSHTGISAERIVHKPVLSTKPAAEAVKCVCALSSVLGSIVII